MYNVLPFKMSNRGESAKHGRRKIALLGFHATCCAHNETNLPLMHHIKIESWIGCKYFVFFSRGQNHLKSIVTSQRRETIFNDHTRGWLSTKTWIKICSNGRISNQLSTTTHNVGVLGSSYKGNIRRANNYQLKKCY